MREPSDKGPLTSGDIPLIKHMSRPARHPAQGGLRLPQTQYLQAQRKINPFVRVEHKSGDP